MQDLIARSLILKVKILDSTIKGGTRKGTSLNGVPPSILKAKPDFIHKLFLYNFLFFFFDKIMSKETDESQSGTIEMNEIPNEKGTSLNGVPFGPCLKTRKKRLSTEEIIDYINWALINNNMKMIKNNSLVFVQKSYKEQTGRDVSITFIRNQKIKMFKEKA